MKKIVALLAMATLFTTVMAQEVSIGGWASTEGRMTTLNQKDLDDDYKKAYYEFGATEMSYTINAVGENFGFTGTLDGWFGRGATGGHTYGMTNARIYSNFNEMFTLHAGIAMKNLNYAPSSIAQGGLFFNDAFGLGMGKYNYETDWNYTSPLSGIIGEVKVAGLEAALAFRGMDGTVDVTTLALDAPLQEDAAKNNLIINAKYDADIVVAYAGLAMRGVGAVRTLADAAADADEDGVNHGLWLAASVNAVEGLTADVKFETNLPKESEDQVNTISLNLGYDLEPVNVASETVISLMDDKGVDGAATMGWLVNLRATPKMVPVVGVSVDVQIGSNNADDSQVATAFALNVNKVIGNVNNQLMLGYDGDVAQQYLEDPVSATIVAYKITMWY